MQFTGKFAAVTDGGSGIGLNDTTELRIGQAKFLYAMSRMAPNATSEMMNKVADSLAAKE